MYKEGGTVCGIRRSGGEVSRWSVYKEGGTVCGIR